MGYVILQATLAQPLGRGLEVFLVPKCDVAGIPCKLHKTQSQGIRTLTSLPPSLPPFLDSLRIFSHLKKLVKLLRPADKLRMVRNMCRCADLAVCVDATALLISRTSQLPNFFLS